MQVNEGKQGTDIFPSTRITISNTSLDPVQNNLPYVYIPPHSVSPRFTGQKIYLDQLQDHFVSQKNSMGKDKRWALVHGTGGIGKTQLALKFAETNSET